jgi:hypothetical protein
MCYRSFRNFDRLAIISVEIRVKVREATEFPEPGSQLLDRNENLLARHLVIPAPALVGTLKNRVQFGETCDDVNRALRFGETGPFSLT